MCGIVGWVEWGADLTTQRVIVEKMTETLRPRGPDAQGYFYSPHAALGHSRLVVVDPLGGSQPMTRSQGGETYTLVYNGELYNTVEIRQQLLSRGYYFTGHSDTEVLLVSFMEWGPACLERLNGIYAFAIWQEAAQTLFLARDRMGVKPLFYTQQGHSFLFASEMKALLAHPAVSPEIDQAGICEIFGLGPARTPGNGVLRGIQELRPGWQLQLCETSLAMRPYWELQAGPHPDDLPTTVEKVRWLVRDAVQRQLVADVPICTFLSGGLDSSLISAYAATACATSGGQLNTYSVEYLDDQRFFQPDDFQPNYDAPWVKRVSDHICSHHHVITIDTPQLVAALEDAVYARDLPGMADIDASLLLFCRAVKQQATVALSGECADEIFGGYPWFNQESALWAGTFPWSQSVEERAALLSPLVRKKVALADYVADAYRSWVARTPVLPEENREDARRREMMYLNLWWFMQTLLDRKDRMSMAAGLEVRVPFCDHRIVEYLWNVPWTMKAQGGREKGLLRAGISGVLPADVVWRKKSPYPKTHHPTYTAAVAAWVQRILADPHAPIRQLVDCAVVQELAESGGSRLSRLSRPWYGQLMAGPQLLAYLVQVNCWLQRYHVRIVDL